MKMTKLEKKFVNSERHAQKNLKLVEHLFTKFDRSNVKKVLEIGCGVGTVASYLSDKYGMKVIATDADPEQIELAKDHYKEHQNLRFFEADAVNLPFKNAEFEMVVSLNVFHHISDWRRVLSEVNRLLKPNGYFLFSDLAYSKIATIVLKPVAKSYGLYTIQNITQTSESEALKLVYRRKPAGIIFTEYSMVFQKG